MNIALCTVGSTGDMIPFIALGKALQAAGHHVKAITHHFHQERFEQHGIPFAGCGPIVSQETLNEMLDKMLSHISPVKQLELLMVEAFFEEGELYFAEAKEALAGMDLAVCHMVDFLGQEAAVQLGIPRIGVVLAPAGIPSDYAAPPLLPNWRPLNRLWWWVLDKTLGRLDRKAMAFLENVGGPHIEVKHYHSLSPDLNLIAASPTLAPTYPDLPEHFSVTGPWVLPAPDYQPDPVILDFLKRYPNPVIVSFGSMGGSRGPWITETVLEALARVEAPAIIQGGYAGLFREDAPENVLFVDYVPHDWLFARGCLVLHHGGAGTTTAACRAGVPSVVVAFIADQPYFGRHLHRLRIAPKTLWFRRMSARRIARRLRQVLGDDAMKARAKHLQAAFLAENGPENAVREIEGFIREHHLETSILERNVP